LAEARTALEGDDVDAINAKAQALTDVAMKMGQEIYSQEQASAASDAPADGDAAGGKSDAEEDVVDAEFSEVDEDSNKG
jgi:molecular chaperone DnaK